MFGNGGCRMKGNVVSRYGKVNDVNIYYLTAASGPPVVLIHGFGGSASYWQLNIEPLAEHFAVYAPDMVGSGCSDKPRAKYSLKYLDQMVNGFVDALELGRVSLIGHSLGGAIVLEFAVAHPDKVRKLVLVSSAGLGSGLSFPPLLLSTPALLNWVLFGPSPAPGLSSSAQAPHAGHLG